MNIQHFKSDTITSRGLGTMAESLRVARERMIDLRWNCENGVYSPQHAATLASQIIDDIFLPVQVLTPPVKTQSPSES
jgi:hypothetical protein